MSVYNRIPSSFFSAQNVLANRQTRKIGFQTWLVRLSDTCIALKHHNTYIAKFEGSTVSIQTNWHSSTTKRRINKALGRTGFSIFQKNFEWNVRDSDGNSFPFGDRFVAEVRYSY